jgi:hypothetical protein
VRVGLAIAVVLMGFATLTSGRGHTEDSKAMPPRVEFVATREGDEIGRCVFEFVQAKGSLEVRIDVQLVVRVLSIPVYRWTHHAVEKWTAGRLVEMIADTDDDGTQRHVELRRDSAGALGLTVDGQWVAVDPDAVPASFWNPAMLTARWLVDSVTGKVGRSATERLADGPLAADAGSSAMRYRITSDSGLKEDVSVSADHRIIGFTAYAQDGSEIVYRAASDR